MRLRVLLMFVVCVCVFCWQEGSQGPAPSGALKGIRRPEGRGALEDGYAGLYGEGKRNGQRRRWDEWTGCVCARALLSALLCSSRVCGRPCVVPLWVLAFHRGRQLRVREFRLAPASKRPAEGKRGQSRCGKHQTRAAATPKRHRATPAAQGEHPGGGGGCVCRWRGRRTPAWGGA
jgi:hypothetical protein